MRGIRERSAGVTTGSSLKSETGDGPDARRCALGLR
jgi:hypothetical protein